MGLEEFLMSDKFEPTVVWRTQSGNGPSFSRVTCESKSMFL